jgi:hypothetical protein
MITAMVRAARPLAPVIAAGAAAVALLVGVGQGIDQVVVVHSHKVVTQNRHDQRLFACLDHRLHQKVPAGTPVALGRNISLYAQRLVEWSTPALKVLPTARGARYLLVVRRSAASPCDGVDVEAQRLP